MKAGIPSPSCCRGQNRIGKARDRGEYVGKRRGQFTFAVGAAAPRTVLLLCTFVHRCERRYQGSKCDLAVLGDGLDRCAEFACIDRMESDEGVDVSEVAPASVGDAAIDGGDDFLSEHHRQRVSQQRHRWEIEIRDATIRLGQLLKLAGVVEDGGQARAVIEAGEVLVDGTIEGRRGAQVRPGQVVSWADEVITVHRGA